MAEMAPLDFMGGNIPVVDSERHLGLLLGKKADEVRVRAWCTEILSKTNMVKHT